MNMRTATTTAAFAAAGLAVLGAAAPAMAQSSGVNAGDLSLVNIDASDALHWQICGQNILTQSFNQNCDNRDHIGEDASSGVNAGQLSGGNLDISDFAHWQICGQNVGVVPSLDQQCLNADHIGGDKVPDKGADQGDY